jgi:hypothetical protein
MNTAKHLASLTNLLVVFVLLASIVCSNFSFTEYSADNHLTIVAKKPDPSAATYAQLLCEEKEKEEDDVSRHNTASNLVLIYHICDLFSSSFPRTQHSSVYNSPAHCGDTTNVPIYLAKRSFLI